MPDVAIVYELAEIYHVSPREVKRWTAFEVNEAMVFINEKRAGEKLRGEIEKFKGSK